MSVAQRSFGREATEGNACTRGRACSGLMKPDTHGASVPQPENGMDTADGSLQRPHAFNGGTAPVVAEEKLKNSVRNQLTTTLLKLTCS